MEKVNLREGFDTFNDQWSPRLAATLNGQAVKLAKVEGEFVWHHHDNSDELFFVYSGKLTIELRDEEDVALEAGDLVVVPQGVEHRPVADDEAEILLFERRDTQNTGHIEDHRTQTRVERLQDCSS